MEGMDLSLLSYFKVKEEQGASLIEVIGSLLIISIIIITVLNLSGFSSLSFLKSNTRTDAMLIAEKELKDTITLIEKDEPLQTVQFIDGYRVIINQTMISNNPTYQNIPENLNEQISLQGVGIDKNGIEYLITVTVVLGETSS
jgi:hypothetical protein